MKTGDIVDFFGIKAEIEDAVGGGYHPCCGCDLAESTKVPAEYCQKGRTLGCSGEKYGSRLPDEHPGDAFIFMLHPCNLPDEYFERAEPPKYWRLAKRLPLPEEAP